MPELVGISEIRREVEAAVKKSAEHCDAQVRLIRAEVGDIKAHTEKKLIPVRDELSGLKRTVHGSGDHELGLVRKSDDHGRRITTVEKALNHSEEMLQDLHTHLMTGKTPRDGTPSLSVPPGRDGTFAVTIPKKFWPLLLVLVFGGPSAVTAAVGAWTAAPQEAVAVQAEAVATMAEQTEIRLREAEERAALSEQRLREASERSAMAEQELRELAKRERRLLEREQAAGIAPVGSGE